MPIRIVALSLCALFFLAPVAQAAGAEFLSRFVWESPDPAHGGFSGLEVYDGGTGFVAITDRGNIAQGTLLRQGDAITGVTTQQFARHLSAEGRPIVAGIKGVVGSYQDSEGLARAPDGSLYITFEGDHRLWAYAGVGTSARPMTSHPQFKRLQENAGLEALAIDDQGALYMVPERSGRYSRPFPIYRLDAGGWSIPYYLPRIGDHLPVGADFGPDGKLYLLERKFSGFRGFSSRVRRFDLGPKGTFTAETVLTTLNLRHGNLEGISVWRDKAGDIRMTMIADDNFSVFQRTEIVEYRLTE